MGHDHSSPGIKGQGQKSTSEVEVLITWPRLIQYGPRSFAVLGAMIWDSLTIHDLSQTFVTFCNRLQIELFNTAHGNSL